MISLILVAASNLASFTVKIVFSGAASSAGAAAAAAGAGAATPAAGIIIALLMPRRS